MLRLVISADSHVMEPLDLWTSHLPQHLRASGPRVEKRGEVSCLMVEDTVVRRFPTLLRTDEGGKSFTWGASDPEGRLRDLDGDGVWGEVIYPNLAFFCCFHIRSAELQVAAARLYNRSSVGVECAGSGASPAPVLRQHTHRDLVDRPHHDGAA